MVHHSSHYEKNNLLKVDACSKYVYIALFMAKMICSSKLKSVAPKRYKWNTSNDYPNNYENKL